MQDLIKAIGRFFENHIEKIVLAIVCGLCAVLFFVWVVLNPNGVKFDGRKRSPGEIDRVILEQAKRLEASLQSEGGQQGAPDYKSVLTDPVGPDHPVVAGLVDRPLPNGLMELFRSPLGFMSDRTITLLPSPGTAESMRRYKLPTRIGAVTGVAANHIRAAAWVPMEELTPTRGYDKVQVEPADMDLVTVEAKFDTVALCSQFRSHFAGEEVARPEWRDPCLADPVFSAVQLQRCEVLGDGGRTPWQDVPRSRVEPYRELFRVIERVEDLPAGGMEVRLMQFDRPGMAMELLQPQPYDIASAEEDWFPPCLYEKYKSLQKKVAMEERREEREKDRTTSTRDGGRYRDSRPGGATGSQATGPGGRYRPSMGGDSAYGGTGGLRDRRSRGGQPEGAYGTGNIDPLTGRPVRRGAAARNRPGDVVPYGEGMYPGAADLMGKASVDEAYWDLGELLITYTTDLSELDKPVLFWAFDDTAEPGHTYVYKVRLGVFNPVAGTDYLAEQDLGKKDQVILWSEFSEETKPVEIPQRLYFFAKDVQDQKNNATVEVARYCLGYWRSEDFDVKPGEVIGKEMKPRRPEDSTRTRPLGARITEPGGVPYNPGLGAGAWSGGGATADADKIPMPDLVDYRTGQVLVDLVQVSDWGEVPNLRPRMYHEMLYTGDGHTIEHMPVSSVNWPKDLQAVYNYVRAETRKEPQPFRAFKKGAMRSRVMPGMEGYQGIEGMYPGAYPGMVERPGGMYR